MSEPEHQLNGEGQHTKGHEHARAQNYLGHRDDAVSVGLDLVPVQLLSNPLAFPHAVRARDNDGRDPCENAFQHGSPLDPRAPRSHPWPPWLRQQLNHAGRADVRSSAWAGFAWVGFYFSDANEVRTVAEQAALSNPHTLAKQWLLDKLDTPSGDWDARLLLSVPGPVWTVASDTCETGRLEAPKNIAYDDLGREFVYRQPADPEELAAIMSADACEVFACYRFDGLRRWNRTSVSLDELLSYQTSGEFNMYLTALHDHLGGQIHVEPRRP